MPVLSSALRRADAAARDGRLDPAAPVRAAAERATMAPPAAVWAVLADLESWPLVLPGVARVRLDDPGSPLADGARFRWTSGGARLRSTIRRAIPGEELTWTGTALWLVAVHRNEIAPASDGGCRLRSSESMSGAGAARLMPAAKLREQLQAMVDAIVAEAERR